MKKKHKQQGVFHAPLKPKDTANQTEGCRHTNPSICGSNSIPEVCAFVREDGMCLKPPKSWPKQFEHLRGKS
jgi:hypothetical protein